MRFDGLLNALAQAQGCKAIELTAPGRTRAWVQPRAQLAYLARHWCGMKTVEVAGRLHRDPSMISRLCADSRADPYAREHLGVAH